VCEVLLPTLRGGGRNVHLQGSRCVVRLAGRDIRRRARPGDGAIGRLATHYAKHAVRAERGARRVGVLVFWVKEPHLSTHTYSNPMPNDTRPKRPPNLCENRERTVLARTRSHAIICAPLPHYTPRTGNCTPEEQCVRGSATPHGAGASATFTGESRGLDADLYIVEVSADLEVAAP
jgi:hypothetical protein